MPSKEEVLEWLVKGILNAPKKGFSLFMRRENFEPYGIMTAKRPEETQKGVREWAMGIKLEDGVLKKIRGSEPEEWTVSECTNRDGFFAEPLQRWDSARGDYEDVYLSNPSGGITVTARRSNRVDDDEDNFRFFMSPSSAEEQRRNNVEVEEKELSISSLKKELESKERELNWWKTRAESLGTKVEDLESRQATLSKKVHLQESMIETYRLESKVSQGLSVQVKSAVSKIMEDAEERGIDIARGEFERAEEAAKKLESVRESMGAMEKEETVGEDISEVKGRLRKIEERLEKAPITTSEEEEEATA